MTIDGRSTVFLPFVLGVLERIQNKPGGRVPCAALRISFVNPLGTQEHSSSIVPRTQVWTVIILLTRTCLEHNALYAQKVRYRSVPFVLNGDIVPLFRRQTTK